MASSIFLNLLPRRATCIIINHVSRRNMPVNVPPTATGKRRFRLAVETDPNKLVNNCCGLNYHKDEPLVKLKPDNEYPDWLWTLRLTEKPNSWELEEGTKEYYLRLREEEREDNYIKRIRSRRQKKVVSKTLLKQQEYLRHIRFAALAHTEEDIGLDSQSIEIDWFAENKERLKVRDYYLPMNENRTLYMDKIGLDRRDKYHQDDESTFKRQVVPFPRKPHRLEPILDSKRRHRYSAF